MNKDEKFIDLVESKKIISILRSMKKTRLSIRVWEKINNSTNYDIFILNEIFEKSLLLKTQNSKLIKFQPQSVLYMHSHERSKLFKTEIIKFGHREIEVRIPEFVKIKEACFCERKHYTPEKQFTLAVHLLGSEYKFQAKVANRSDNGVGLIVDQECFDHILENDELYLGGGPIRHLVGRKAIVRHLTPLVLPNPSSHHQYQMGIEIIDN